MVLIKGVIFDLGSTLVEFTSNWPDVVQAGAEATADWYIDKKHLKLDKPALVQEIFAERKKAFALAGETLEEAQMLQILVQATQNIGASKRAEALAEQALRAFFAPEEAAHRPFPDAVDTLKQLRAQSFKVGILSNAPDDALIQRMVNDNHLRPWASPVFSSAGLGRRKPAPEPFACFAERWRLPPEQIVVVGDTLAADILGGKNAGMHSILATMRENPDNENHRHIRPDRTVETLAQVPLVLAQMNGKSVVG